MPVNMFALSPFKSWVRVLSSMLSVLLLIYGTRVTATEPINVPGIKIKGKAIPITRPNSLRASLEFKPAFISLSGIITEIRVVTKLETVLNVVIEDAPFKTGLICPLGELSL